MSYLSPIFALHSKFRGTIYKYQIGTFFYFHFWNLSLPIIEKMKFYFHDSYWEKKIVMYNIILIDLINSKYSDTKMEICEKFFLVINILILHSNSEINNFVIDFQVLVIVIST